MVIPSILCVSAYPLGVLPLWGIATQVGGRKIKHHQALLSLILLMSLLALPGCIDWISDLLDLGKRIQVHDYTNVTLKLGHLLVPEGTPGALLIAYTGRIGLGKGGSKEFPLDDTWTVGQFKPTPEDHARAFNRLYFQIWYPGSATFDLGAPCSSVYIALSQDHGPYPEEALEYKVAVSNDGVNFTPLPTDTSITLFRRGWSAAGEDPITGSVLEGNEPPGEREDSGPWPDVLNDDLSARWDLPQPARFIRITPLSASPPYNEPEIDAVKCLKWAPKPAKSRFIYPVLGISVSDPLQNTRDPREDGWYVANGFGNSCPECSGDPTHPYHPGEDWNRVDGNDANLPVYAIADGEVIRSHKMSDALGWAVIIRHRLPREIDIIPYVLPRTIPPKQKTQVISSAYLHLNEPRFGELDVRKGDQSVPIHKGDEVGTIYPDTPGGPHLHFEIRANDDPRTADPSTNVNGYYASWQEITDFGYIDPSKFLQGQIGS